MDREKQDPCVNCGQAFVPDVSGCVDPQKSGGDVSGVR
jgi:hypothetical protein